MSIGYDSERSDAKTSSFNFRSTHRTGVVSRD